VLSMRAVRLNPLLRMAWKVHRAVFKATGGRLGSRLGGNPVLLLGTTGHSSGLPRSVGLFFLESDGRYFVAGTYAGEDRDPAWAKNLFAQPKATVTLRGRTLPVVARVLDGAEREEVVDRFIQAEPAYGEYRERTTRVFPVFELRPEGA
jgi:deazaflavin-dependent oxidoreductase (nitroreductase family)